MTDDKKLVSKVVQRQKLVEAIIDFVQFITEKKGKVLSRSVHSGHTQTERELKNFFGFSFYTYGHYTMFGGEEVKVWYHPKDKKLPPELVFEVEWWEILKCNVKHFDPSPEWLAALKKLMEDRSRVVAKAEKAEQRKAAEEEKNRKDQAAMKTVQEDAKRLGLQ
jgi:hypothetical protein